MAQSKKKNPPSHSVEMPAPVKIILKNLVYDPKNPNEMSQEQEAGLTAMMKRFGFLSSIVVSPKNKKGKQLIHHGEHRVRELLKAGNTWAYGYVRKYSEIDHIFLRQGMNKTHGAHEAAKDAVEIAFVQKKKMLKLFATIVGQPEELLEINQETILVTKDKEMIQHHKETFLEGNLKQLYFVFSNAEYLKLMPRVEKIVKFMRVDNNTDMFWGLIKSYEDNHFKKKR